MRTPEQIEALVPVSERNAQRFPRLREAHSRASRSVLGLRRGTLQLEKSFDVGDRSVSTWFLLKGSAELFSRDGFETAPNVRRLYTSGTPGLSSGPRDFPEKTSPWLRSEADYHRHCSMNLERKYAPCLA
jgi:hypothetical protein